MIPIPDVIPFVALVDDHQQRIEEVGRRGGSGITNAKLDIADRIFVNGVRTVAVCIIDAGCADGTGPDGRKIQCIVDGIRSSCNNAWMILRGGYGNVVQDESDRYAMAMLGLQEVRSRVPVFGQPNGRVRVYDETGRIVSDDWGGPTGPPAIIGYREEISWEMQNQTITTLGTVSSTITNRPLEPYPRNPLMNDCEKYLAKLFTGLDDMIFSDVTDGSPVDTLRGQDENPANSTPDAFQTHNHLYNPLSDPYRLTKIYVPLGGVLIGSGQTSVGNGSQTYTTIFYANLNGVKNVTLQIFHASEDGIKGTLGKDGLVGAMGTNGGPLITFQEYQVSIFILIFFKGDRIKQILPMTTKGKM